MAKKISKQQLEELVLEELQKKLQEIELQGIGSKIRQWYTGSSKKQIPITKSDKKPEEPAAAAEEPAPEEPAPAPEEPAPAPEEPAKPQEISDPDYIITDLDDSIIKNVDKMKEFAKIAQTSKLSQEQVVLILKGLVSPKAKGFNLFFENIVATSSKKPPRTTPQSLGIENFTEFQQTNHYKNMYRNVTKYLEGVKGDKRSKYAQHAATITPQQLEIFLMNLFINKKIAVPVPAGAAGVKSQETAKAVQQPVNENIKRWKKLAGILKD